MKAILSIMLIAFGVIVGMNESELCFVFILAGIIGMLYAIKSSQYKQS